MTQTQTPQEDLEKRLQIIHLKYQALKERISTIVTSYEDQDAERRTEITLLTTENKILKNQIEELESAQQEEEVKAKKSK